MTLDHFLFTLVVIGSASALIPVMDKALPAEIGFSTGKLERHHFRLPLWRTAAVALSLVAALNIAEPIRLRHYLDVVTILLACIGSFRFYAGRDAKEHPPETEHKVEVQNDR